MRLAWSVIAACLVLAWAGCAWDNRFVYHPTRYPEGDWRPEQVGAEDAYFQADDGTRLHGWFVEHPRPRAVVLIAHGNAGNLSDRWPLLELMRNRLGVSAMIFDYRGFGRSEGTPSERGVLADARAARRWLAHRTGVSESQIVLYGQSLGGGVMVDLAARDGARALVLESTFTSLPDVASKQVPWLPVGWLMTNRYDSLAKIARYHGPLLQAHGDADRLIAIDDARDLYEAAPTNRKRFVTIPGAGHNWAPTRQYVEELDRFLGEVTVARTADRR